MASTDVVVSRGFAWPRLLGFLEREGLAVGVVAAYAASASYGLPQRVAQDAWFALVGGRQIVQHGLPGADTLTYWTAGRHWVDQQWVAQVASFGLYSLRGLKLFALTHLALVVLALALVVVAARRRGASPRAVAWMSLPVIYLLALAAGHVRTQSFAYPLFAAVLMLLLGDARRPSRRVFLVLPMLVLWANVHGSVVLGATLVALHGLLLLMRRERAKGGALVAGAALSLIATPWFFGTLGYYHSTLFNSTFKNILAEWRPPTLTLALVPLFALAAGALWLLGHFHRTFTAFETTALLLLLALAFLAQRNIVWLALASMPLLAPALDKALPRPSRQARASTNVAFGLLATFLGAVVVLVAVLRSENAYLDQWPSAAATAVARVAKADGSARIYANEQYADWLLMTHPELAGRVAYDVRFELLSGAQLKAIFRWRSQIGPTWVRAAQGARVLVLALPVERGIARVMIRAGARVLYRDGNLAVLLRGQAEDSAKVTA